MSKKSLLDLKKDIAELDYNIFFETKQVQDKKRIQYRFRKATGMRKKLEKNFREEIDSREEGSLAIGFWNLTQTTYLVIPTKGYLHISDFARRGSDEEWLACWKIIKDSLELGEYISTHGFGVAWVHFRIEEKPKYYTW